MTDLYGEQELLEGRLELEADRALEVQHALRVLERVGGLVLGQVPHVLVEPEHDGEQDELAEQHAAVASVPEAGDQPAQPFHAPACYPIQVPQHAVRRGAAQLGFGHTPRARACQRPDAPDGFLRNRRRQSRIRGPGADNTT